MKEIKMKITKNTNTNPVLRKDIPAGTVFSHVLNPSNVSIWVAINFRDTMCVAAAPNFKDSYFHMNVVTGLIGHCDGEAQCFPLEAELQIKN